MSHDTTKPTNGMCVPNKESDQPWYPPSLTTGFHVNLRVVRDLSYLRPTAIRIAKGTEVA